MGMLTLTALLFWLLTDDAFRVTEASVSFEGLRHADEAEVRDYLTDLDRGPNVFRVRASEIVSELSDLTEVDAAFATVTLPGDVSVRLDERDPLFIWVGERAWLVDEEGMLFAPGEPAMAIGDPEAIDDDPEAVDTETGTDDSDPVARESLPVVEDARLTDVPPSVGSYLSPADMEVMRQLLALTPELLESDSESLHLRVDEHEGYVLESHDLAWSAIFRRYTPSVQPPHVVPRQVQCLRWLLASKEAKLDQVRLALSDSACGTWTELDSKPAKGN